MGPGRRLVRGRRFGLVRGGLDLRLAGCLGLDISGLVGRQLGVELGEAGLDAIGFRRGRGRIELCLGDRLGLRLGFGLRCGCSPGDVRLHHGLGVAVTAERGDLLGSDERGVGGRVTVRAVASGRRFGSASSESRYSYTARCRRRVRK